MKKILKAATVLTITLLISSNSINAQNNPKITKDGNLDTLLALKQTLEARNDLINGYTIQIHYGGMVEKAKKIRDEYDAKEYVWSATIEYENPNFKVWVGNFETRLEADRALMKLNKDFVNAFILKPERK